MKMKQLLAALVLLAAPSVVHAQQVTLSVPVTVQVPTNATTAKQGVNLTVLTNIEDKESGTVTIVVGLMAQDGAVLKRTSLTFPDPDPNGPCPNATIKGLENARGNPRQNEQPNAGVRTQNFRLLGYLVDQGCLSGGTAAP
jgi:hypothetical protein